MNQLADLLVQLNNNYLNHYNTVIIGGFDEPFYQAATPNKPAEIQFSHDYIRSALHELAHWCVAGIDRRQLDDYGYWYAQDGRNQVQQNEFFKVEVKPQAIEWAFCLALDVPFEASVDNLASQVTGIESFQIDLKNQLNHYIQNGFPQRTQEVLKLLSNIRDVRGILELK